MLPGVEPEVERVANAIMMAFIKKWFHNPAFKYRISLDYINGEMAWLDEARAAIAAVKSS